eukprot:6222983-Prymnesium_polylepis.1
MHTVIRQPKHKFGPILEVRQVRVFGRTRPELHNGGGLGKRPVEQTTCAAQRISVRLSTLSVQSGLQESRPHGSRKAAVAGEGGGSAITSGGGFSKLLPRPQWQRSAVDGYFAAGGAPIDTPAFWPGGRGLPDIAMAGNMLPIVVGG